MGGGGGGGVSANRPYQKPPEFFFQCMGEGSVKRGLNISLLTVSNTGFRILDNFSQWETHVELYIKAKFSRG